MIQPTIFDLFQQLAVTLNHLKEDVFLNSTFSKMKREMRIVEYVDQRL